MKKFFGMLPILFIIFALPVSASAETTAGIKPNSFLYSFDLLGEKISLFFTKDPYEKAKKNILFSDERIAEIEAVKDDTKAQLRAANEFEKDVSGALQVFEDIKSNDQKAGVLISFENRYTKNWDVLMNVYNSLSDEDKPVLRETLFTYLDNLEKGAANVQKLIAENETKNTTESDSATKTDIESLRKEIASLKQQKAPTVTALKTQNPTQYNNLVSENKTQLQEANKNLSNKTIIAKVKPAVVYIETIDGSGSGIIIGSDGYILTNAHVVVGSNSATVKLTDGRSFNGAVIGRDENIDLALLKVSATGLVAATLGDSDSVEQGDPVFTFGYPFGIEGDVSFKTGVLSGHRKVDNITYLEISAQILPGNSGGPLVDESGRVVGINTWAQGVGKISGVLIGETLKYALPINIAKGIISDLKNGRNIVVPKSSVVVPTTPAPANPSQPALPPSTFAPAPEPKPEPVRTTISNIVAKEESYGLVISWDSNKSTSYGGWRALIGKQSDLSDAVEIKPTYKSATYSPVSENTTYYYQVFVKDGCTQCLSYDPVEAKSDILSITTKERTQKVISATATKIDAHSAEITFEANLATWATFEFRRESESNFTMCSVTTFTTADCDETLGKNTSSKEHKYFLTNLSPADKYYYRVSLWGGDGTGATIISDLYSFDTPAEQ